MRTLVLAFVAMAAAPAAADIRDIDGHALTLLRPAGRANVLFFVMTDCPISNAYAPEIQRTCREYRARGVDCALIYEDAGIAVDAVRAHLREYAYEDIPAAIDPSRDVASAAGASITPTAVLVDNAGRIRYRGRIDNLYAALGRTRRQVTERWLRSALDAVLAERSVRISETPAIGCHIVPATVLERLQAPGHAHH
jgi:hypothetical protein